MCSLCLFLSVLHLTSFTFFPFMSFYWLIDFSLLCKRAEKKLLVVCFCVHLFGMFWVFSVHSNLQSLSICKFFFKAWPIGPIFTPAHVFYIVRTDTFPVELYKRSPFLDVSTWRRGPWTSGVIACMSLNQQFPEQGLAHM